MTESIRDELAELTLALCNIPSETCNEAEIATWIQHRCVQAAGAHSVKRIGHTIICEPYARTDRPGEPTIALVGHTDTVKCAEDQAYEIRDGRLLFGDEKNPRDVLPLSGFRH